MNGSASQSSASSASQPPTPTLLKPAPAATTPQQVAAAAAALAASRAASVSAAMRSVFGAKQQAALASAMMNASVNAAASKAKAAAAASTTAGPSRTNTAAAAAPALARPTAAAQLQAMASHATSVVVMQSSSDGLPVLHPHAASCREDDTAALASDVPRDGAVTLFGEVTSRAAIRAALVDHYASTNQLSNTSGNCAVSEMTLRVDTELEMLRRQCFAERNARWQFATPDDFAPALAMATPSAWIAAPYMGPRRQTLLLRKYHDHQRLHGTDGKASETSTLDPHQDELLQSLVGIELVRDRVWPPKEFMAKANTKPSRGGPGANAANHSGGGSTNRTSSGKKKPVGMVGVVDETPVVARVCSECSTQSSALWRKRPRVASAAVLAPVADEEDVCLPCFLKTQRRDLFERKTAERARRVKEEAARVAAEARALKKQQQQMQKKIRKLQQLQQQQSVADEDEDVGKGEVTTSEDAAPVVETVRVQDEDSEPAAPRAQLKLTRRDSMSSSVAASSYEKDTSRAVDGDAVDDKKTRGGRDKKSKKDKKKKKKKKRRKLSLESDDEQDETNGWDDSDSDDNGARRVVMPSPPQRPMDGLVYADRTDTLSVKDSSVRDEPDASHETTAKRTSHKRGAAKAIAVSKKRKSVDVDETTPVVVVVPPPTTPTQRRGRKATSSTAAAASAVVTPTTPSATATRKRAGRPSTSTKKETARERELRALGQYCPVCNTTYEEDDARPFVCCDSCEMWVHAACDASLTPAALATLADSTEKYICPLCGGR